MKCLEAKLRADAVVSTRSRVSGFNSALIVICKISHPPAMLHSSDVNVVNDVVECLHHLPGSAFPTVNDELAHYV